MEPYAEVWCQVCPEAADGPDGFCTPHREGVPSSITDPWLAGQYLQNVRRRRTQKAAHDARINAARAAYAARKD